MRNLDEIDVKILNMLKKNARTPLKELSAEVFLTTPAVSSRMEKLEREGYIKGYHAALDMEKLGYGIKAFIMITVEPEDSKKFYEFIKEQRCVLECDHITGPYSMIMKVVFPSTTLLDEFLGKLQVFGKTETQVVFSNVVERR
ncbi:Lrp/AsnC family transcriptional regulator [Ihubacter sp. mB4P-1]|uniref:Lrp/AsnC family transcriptional regulator n=1 Tax=Ihubacter sp. mB4P-1 TaxID=3242370 RepID=UPI003C7D7A1A